MKARQRNDLTYLYLLSKYFNMKTKTVDQTISFKEEEEFNNRNSISMKIISFCIHSFFSTSNEYKNTASMQSLYIIFEDYLNDLLKSSIMQNDISRYINRENLIKKKNVFIPVCRNNKWSLIVIENIHKIFVNDVIGKHYASNNSERSEHTTNSPLCKFRIMVITPNAESISVKDIVSKIEKFFILGGLHNYDGKMLFNKDKLNKEIQNGVCVITLPKKINEYETTLVLIKLIQGGVRSISINLYLNSLLNTVFDSEYLAEVKTALYPTIQRIVQSNNGTEDKLKTIPVNKKKNAIKEIPIHYSGDKKKKTENIIYRKTVVPKNPMKKPNSLNINLIQEFKNNHSAEINDIVLELDCLNTISPQSHYQSHYQSQSQSQGRHTYSRKNILTKTGIIDLAQYSSFKKNDLEEPELELSPIRNHSKSNFEATAPIYHHKNISNKNLRLFQLNSKDISIVSQPTIENSTNNNLDSTDASILNQNTNNKKLMKVTGLDEELFTRNENMALKPKQSRKFSNVNTNEILNKDSNGIVSKKPTERKPTEKKYNSFIEVYNYSSYVPTTEEKISNPNDPCAQCGGNTDCIIF